MSEFPEREGEDETPVEDSSPTGEKPADERETGRDDDRVIVICPNEACAQKLSIPRSTESLEVLCPKCGTSFVVRATRKPPPWLLSRVKAHPVFLGLLVTFWSFIVLGPLVNSSTDPRVALLVTLGFFAFWLFGSLLLDWIHEDGVPWHHRKWFVILLLIVLPPVGIALLWSGSRFRKPVKAGLSFVSCVWFLFNVFQEVSPIILEPDASKVQVISLLQSPKGKIHLVPASDSSKTALRDEIMNPPVDRPMKPLVVPEIAKRFGDSIVLVRSLGRRGRQLGLGSGFVVGRTGAVATNYHVVASASEVSIEFVDGRIFPDVSLIVSDASKDLAVLQIDLGGSNAPDSTLVPVVLGNSDELEVGERVVAIGNPYSWENTLSDGLISGIRELAGTTLLQITTPISPGSSGGALFNMRGEVVGITTIGSTWGAQNLNFAVPVNSLKALIAGRNQSAL